jgi:hypothetical protein
VLCVILYVSNLAGVSGESLTKTCIDNLAKETIRHNMGEASFKELRSDIKRLLLKLSEKYSACETTLDYPGIFESGCNNTGESAYSSQASSSIMDSSDSGWQHHNTYSVTSSSKSESTFTFNVFNSDMMSLDRDDESENEKLIGLSTSETTKPAIISPLVIADKDSKSSQCQGQLLSQGEFCAYSDFFLILQNFHKLTLV